MPRAQYLIAQKARESAAARRKKCGYTALSAYNK